ncbi:LysR family transcriptional regulator [Acinetobacter pittii]|jgi:DNA-binding transcriptional LysR family regulator|uniref:LysR family transcriptional regulator n=1 Tax=Acinetobacter pittii TaxID=48296 RepID=UPI001EFC30D9|nr:LysR family transcriptional regulator [Acinetobacter pittii]MCG9516053.1 LysR family transcriptional regulator [Acinetobacter pittii]
MEDLDSFFSSRIKFKNLKILSLLGQHKSLTKVAQLMHMTTSAVSKSLAEIETNYGAQLFRREVGQLVPLPECLILIDSYLKIEAQLREGHDRIALLRGVKASRISIGVHAPSLENALANAIIRFKKISPETEICIKAGDKNSLLSSLRAGELDLVMCRAEVDDLNNDLRAILLHEHQLLFIANNNLNIPDSNKDLKSLLQYPWCLTAPTCPVRQCFDANLVANGLKQPNNIIEVDNPINLIGIIMQNYECITVASSNIARKLQRQNKVKIINRELSFNIKPQIIIWNSKVPLNTNVRKLRDFICYEAH